MSRRNTHDELLSTLEDTILRGPGESEATLREKAARGELDGALGAYVKLVQQGAYKVSAEQLAELRKTYSDDVLFELTVAASFGAARRRHELAMSAIDSAWGNA